MKHLALFVAEKLHVSRLLTTTRNALTTIKLLVAFIWGIFAQLLYIRRIALVCLVALGFTFVFQTSYAAADSNIYSVDGTTVEFDSVSAWFLSYEIEDGSVIDAGQSLPSTVSSTNEQDSYEWLVDGFIYAALNYVDIDTEQIIEDAFEWGTEALGIENAPTVNSIDGVIKFATELVSKTLFDFFTFIVDEVFKRLPSVF